MYFGIWLRHWNRFNRILSLLYFKDIVWTSIKTFIWKIIYHILVGEMSKSTCRKSIRVDRFLSKTIVLLGNCKRLRIRRNFYC